MESFFHIVFLNVFYMLSANDLKVVCRNLNFVQTTFRSFAEMVIFDFFSNPSLAST